jgi:lipopolysaccharide biosynthesis glycosyltransferase
MNICYSLFDYTGLVSILSLFNAEKIDSESIHLYVLFDERGPTLVPYLERIVSQYHVKLTLLDARLINTFCEAHGIPAWQGHYLTYARLYLSVLCPNVDRMIYVDSDTLVLKSLKELWSFDLKGKALGAVHEVSYYDVSYNNDQIGPNLSETMNAGVLLMDLNRLRKIGLVSNFLQRGGNVLKSGGTDQDFLNEALIGDVAYIPLVYNSYALIRAFPYHAYKKHTIAFERYSKSQFCAAQRHPTIAHFNATAYDRPWYQDNCCRYSHKWRSLYKIIFHHRFTPVSLPSGHGFSTRVYRKLRFFISRCLPLSLSYAIVRRLKPVHHSSK